MLKGFSMLATETWFPVVRQEGCMVEIPGLGLVSIKFLVDWERDGGIKLFWVHGKVGADNGQGE